MSIAYRATALPIELTVYSFRVTTPDMPMTRPVCVPVSLISGIYPTLKWARTVTKMVEKMGIEPTTAALQVQLATLRTCLPMALLRPVSRR